MDKNFSELKVRERDLESILASINKLKMESAARPMREIQGQREPVIAPMREVQKRLEPLIAPMKAVLAQYPVKRAALFGSAARQDMTDLSDIDMLVEFHPNTSGLDFYGLGVDLEETLGRPVDLIVWNELRDAKPHFRQNMESEARLIYES